MVGERGETACLISSSSQRMEFKFDSGSFGISRKATPVVRAEFMGRINAG